MSTALPPHEEGYSLDPSGGAQPPRPLLGDLGVLNIDVKRSPVGDLGPAAVTEASEEAAVLAWMTAHRADIALAAA